MLENFIRIIEQGNLINKNDKIIVGLSGGPDSVCLFFLLCKLREQLNFEIVAAHLDHGWRNNSAHDVLFCKELSEKYNVSFISKKADEITLNKKLYGSSKEELGRIYRRQFFSDLLKSHKATAVALAHHWDDQIETFFIRLIRGSTISGLSCMQTQSEHYIRPLINFTKEEILSFLDTNKLEYLTDETNESDLFLRNKIRKYLVPTIRNIDSRFDKNFKKAIDSILETNQFIEKLTEKNFLKMTYQTNNSYWIIKDLFWDIDPYLHKNLIITWLCKHNVAFPLSSTFLNEIIKFFKQPGSGEHKIHTQWTIFKDKKYLKIVHTLNQNF